MVVIETPRLTLNAWHLDDFDAFAPIARDTQVMRFIAAGEPWPDRKIAYFIGRQTAFQQALGHSMWNIRLKETDKLVGLCGLQPLADTGEIEVGWWLASALWGRGLATEAARAAVDWGFRAHALQRVVAIAHPDNTASLNIMGKLGMTDEGPQPNPYDAGDVASFAIESESWNNSGTTG